MSKISTLDLLSVMTDIPFPSVDSEKARNAVDEMFKEKKDYKYDNNKSLRENVVAALPQYSNLDEFATYCNSVVKTLQAMEVSGEELYKSSELQTLAYFDFYKMPKIIDTMASENPYKKVVELSLGDIISASTERVVEGSSFRMAFDNSADAIRMSGIKFPEGASKREMLCKIFERYNLEGFMRDFDRSLEVAKLMGLNERQAFTIEAINVLAEPYNFPEKFTIDQYGNIGNEQEIQQNQDINKKISDLRKQFPNNATTSDKDGKPLNPVYSDRTR